MGDWIEMPQFGADGDVVDVQLHKDYVKNKEQDLADYNAALATEVDAEVNRRRLLALRVSVRTSGPCLPKAGVQHPCD